ncbi:hypothetical protein ZIOFF_024233 [Zingiber officinale]|uniref:dUTP diphosphatase n=1 Tax=Zingiber officinale TaxID=94328 RepID=A0A8J5H020_ZINOF|nr:hypothetical protein ZIOFF_024233 [Zingiber officinale]
MDPQTQLRLSMQERAAIVPAEVLYHSRRDDAHHRVYIHRSEEAMLVTENQIDRAFIQQESYAQLQRSGMRFLHMGVIQVRIQILHRQEEVTMALVVFRDNRWQGDQAIFATMEIDLTHGSQLVYVIPDTMLTVSDFYRNIQVSILTRCYEGWRNGEANLLITRGLVGRLSNTPNVGFAYEVQNVVDYLVSHGVDCKRTSPNSAVKGKSAEEPTEYKGTSSSVTAVIKQSNTQIQLLVSILEKLEALEERIKRLEERAVPAPQALPEAIIQSLTERVKSLSLQEKPKEAKVRAAIVPAEVLYHSRRDDAHHRVYIHRSEEAMLVTENQIDRAFIQQESYAQLQRSGMRFLHMGVIQGDQAIFATMEIDLTHGSQLVYVIPDTMLTTSDFYRNIQVSILTRGYEGWRNGEANLLITRGLVGRLSNTPNVGFAYEVQNVVDYLVSHGVRALPGRSYSTRDILGHNWIIRQSTVNIPMQPTEVNTRNLLDGSVSLKFDNYQTAATLSVPKYNSKDEEIQSDEEEITNHTIAVLIEQEQEEEMLVKRISSLAQLPVRSTTGAAGYDLSITHAQNIPAKDKSLLSTGLCIQIPKNTYARIAPRSSAVIKGIMIMGGVIDSDYRGAVKILAFNTTNKDIFLNKQECIAQIILERISTPTVKEVDNLENTPRGDKGFGSTTRALAFRDKPEGDAGFNFEARFTNPVTCSKTGPNPQCPGCHFCYEEDFYSPSPNYNHYATTTEEEVLTLQAQARQHAIQQHKFLEEEAYQ